MTFAYYLPKNYSLAKFRDRSLDYDYKDQSTAVELWGMPKNVVLGIEAHNEAIKKIAYENSADVLYLDENSIIPKNGVYFNDIIFLQLVRLCSLNL